jgi:hypothetical protein
MTVVVLHSVMFVFIAMYVDDCGGVAFCDVRIYCDVCG